LSQTRFVRRLRKLAIALPLALATLAASADTITDNIIGNYELFGGSYANTLTGSAALPALNVIASSGTFGFVTTGTDPGWFWSGASAPGTGLTVTGLPANDGGNFGNYSIGMRLALGQVSGYRRLIYFKNSDLGQYVDTGAFEFYNDADNPSGGSLTADTTVDFVLTRDAATKEVRAYLNGSSTPIFTFTDGSNDAVTTADRTLRFFRDDGGDFSPSGAAALIRIWKAPLTAADIPTAMTAVVPEPAAATLATIAAAGLLLLRLRKARRLG
jgi:hypothetical protein